MAESSTSRSGPIHIVLAVVEKELEKHGGDLEHLKKWAFVGNGKDSVQVQLNSIHNDLQRLLSRTRRQDNWLLQLAGQLVGSLMMGLGGALLALWIKSGGKVGP